MGKKHAGLAGVGLAISDIALNISDIDNVNVEEKTAKEVGNKLVGPMVRF